MPPMLVLIKLRAPTSLDHVMLVNMVYRLKIPLKWKCTVRFTLQVLDNDYISAIEFGVRYSDRTYTNDRSVLEYGDDGAFSTTEAPLKLTEDMTTIVDWKGEFSNFPSYLAIDNDKALAAWFPNGVPQPVQTWGADSSGVMNESYAWTMHQSGEVYETVNSAYLWRINTEVSVYQ